MNLRHVAAWRVHAVGVLASVAAVAVVTGAIYGFRTFVPVLSLGVLYLFAVLPIALWAGEASALPLIGLLALPMAFAPMRAMTNRTDGPSLNGALAATGAVLAVYSLLVTAGLLISS